MKNIVVFDIDGTLIDISKRQQWLKTNPKNWKKFREDHSSDTPIYNIITLLRSLSKDFTIVLVSARIESERDITIFQLKKYNIIDYVDKIYLRMNGDYRDDTSVKEDLLKDLIRDYNRSPILWFDDRDKVVKHIRSLGITVCQVAEGNF